MAIVRMFTLYYCTREIDLIGSVDKPWVALHDSVVERFALTLSPSPPGEGLLRPVMLPLRPEGEGGRGDEG